MFTKRIIGWSGLLAAAAGSFWALYEMGQIAGLISPLLDPRLDLVAHSLVGLAAIGIYARMSERAGVFGLIAFCLYMIMALANAAMKMIYTVVIPTLASQYPEAGAAIGATAAWTNFTALWMSLTVLGPVLFGVAAIYSRILPRWAGALLVAGPIASLTVGPALTAALGLSGNLGAVMSAAAWVWLGYATWEDQTVMLAEPQPAATMA